MLRTDGEAKAQLSKADCKYKVDFISAILGLDVENKTM